MKNLDEKSMQEEKFRRIRISHKETPDEYPNTRAEVRMLSQMFAKEFYNKNANTSEKSPLKRINLKINDFLNRDLMAKSTYKMIMEALGGNQDAKSPQRSIRSNFDPNFRTYLVRDLDRDGALVGFTVAEIGTNGYIGENDDGTSQKMIVDQTESEEINVGSKIAAYILPEYRTMDNAIINGKINPPRIAIGLNNMIDDWFKNKGVKFQYATTGKRMQRNVIAYIANGFFIQSVEGNFVKLKKDEVETINHKQRAYLTRGVKEGKFHTADYSKDIPEATYRKTRSKSFDSELRVDYTTLEKIVQIGKSSRYEKRREYQAKKEKGKTK